MSKMFRTHTFIGEILALIGIDIVQQILATAIAGMFFQNTLCKRQDLSNECTAILGRYVVRERLRNIEHGLREQKRVMRSIFGFGEVVRTMQRRTSSEMLLSVSWVAGLSGLFAVSPPSPRREKLANPFNYPPILRFLPLEYREVSPAVAMVRIVCSYLRMWILR